MGWEKIVWHETRRQMENIYFWLFAYVDGSSPHVYLFI